MSDNEGPCRTYWSDGHMCMSGRGHAALGFNHRCASTNCPVPWSAEVTAVWGPDAGVSAYGELPTGAAPDRPWRKLRGVSR